VLITAQRAKNQRFFCARYAAQSRIVLQNFFCPPRAKIAKIEDFARYVQPPQKPRGDFTTRRNFDTHPNKRLNCSPTR